MNDIDRRRLDRLVATFERNFRITRLYAEYLERYPEVISKEMIDALTDDGSITKEEAIVALLSEIFALDFENREDRILIRDYLTPSVRLLDAEKYENNPYYRNIKLDNIIDGNWEIRWEEYKPYRAVIAGDMIIGEDFSEVPPLGFFEKTFRFPAVLEGGNEWMTLTPVDLDTCDEAIKAAHGKVVTFGLGLGYYAYMVSEKETVDEVTVVELSEGVIKLFRKYILPQMPNAHKIKIVNADAFEYAKNTMPCEHFDYAFVDTWRDASDGAPMYERMRKLEKYSPNTKFSYWIENFLISRLRAEKFAKLMQMQDEKSPDFPKSYKEFINLLNL
ncbi:MAG: hypothetical protein J6K85_01265 [Clostridia bacterium]|nr:hypothetical protein [Clostridia bacterium]